MIKRSTLLIALTLAACSIALGQDEFIYAQEGLIPSYLVVDLDSLEQNELFTKTINWIKETYKNPDEVIKTTIENEKVRFEGFKDDLICTNSLGMVYCYYGLYVIEIEFKDNKYKFTPLSIEFRVPASQYSAGGMVSINLNDGTAYFNKKGVLRKMYETLPMSVERLLNDLNYSLSNYLFLEKSETDKEDW